MQEITQQNTSKVGIQPVLDFDVESFDFKPVTKGLGFHQDKNLETKNRSYSKASTKPRQERHNREIVSLDYHNESHVEPKKKAKKKVRDAKLGVLFTAFIFDFFIIAGTQTILNLIFLKLSGLTNLVNFLEFTWIEQSLFFVFFFLFYFTILDLVASPGKRIFNLRLRSTISNKVSIDQTLIRSVVTILSFITALMPLLFDFQGKLSDTKVIEDV